MKEMTAKGLKPTLDTAYTPGEKDYSALVSRMKAANIDVIYIGGYHTEAGLIIRQAKEQGMNPTMISGDALVTKEFWQISGPAGEGTLMTFAPDLEKRPSAAAVVKEFKDKNIDPEGYTLYSYAVGADLGRRCQEGRHGGPEEGCGDAEERRAVAEHHRADHASTRRVTSTGPELCVLCLEGRQLRGDVAVRTPLVPD